MRGVILAIALSAGCYAELGAGYYPTINQTITDQTTMTESSSRSGGWSATFKLGFYLDVPIAPLRTGIGLGWSPDSFGGDPVLPSDASADVTPKGTTFRGDVVLPFIPFKTVPNLLVRLTAIRAKFTGVGVRMAPNDEYEHSSGASGTGWFFGPTIGTSKLGSAALASIGYQTLDCELPVGTQAHLPQNGVRTSASGFGIRVLIGWTPSGALMKHYKPSPNTPQARGNAGCYYRNTCIPRHGGGETCTSDYYCP
ncbi:MAG: hypothetical protein H0T46_20515 [Deltaproteobacteria bacterium]|nr:hypothetical protein [Deltaproteobacteria bacterium]